MNIERFDPIEGIIIRALTQIEGVVQQESHVCIRDMMQVFNETRGNLELAARSIADTEEPSIGIITGSFIIEAGIAETDGPSSAALLAAALSDVGVPCHVITDEACESVCKAALEGAGAKNAQLLIVNDAESSMQKLEAKCNAINFTHMISTERPGRSRDGNPRNMHGGVVERCVSFDELFVKGGWQTIAIGDGGNEIGMGRLPFNVIAHHIPHGPEIACSTTAKYLIASGVSNWGMNGLIAALAVLRPEWRKAMLATLKPPREKETLKHMVNMGAVDGISKKNEETVDQIPLEFHLSKTRSMVDIVSSVPYPRRVTEVNGPSVARNGNSRGMGKGKIPAANYMSGIQNITASEVHVLRFA